MPDLSGYKLTFDDEFSSLSVSQSGVGTTWADIRTANRLTPTSDSGFGNSDAAFVDPASGINPFSIENGALTISATPSQSPVVGSKDWASGILDTQASFSQQYGYFEMRAELPQQAGAWPAFWLLAQDNTPVLEIDAVEAYGTPGLYSTVHSNLIPGGSQSDYSYQPTAATGFHTYGVLWNANTISFYFDGKLTSSQPTPADMQRPMYMLVDLSIKPEAGLSQAPKGMTIDYIRAFSNAPNAQAVPLGQVNSPDGLTTADLEGATSACFLAGTSILTPMGGCRVEQLVAGDLVVTASGVSRRILWIGHRTVDCRRHPRPQEVMPVRFAAHTFAENKPSRELFVSPGHAICVDVVGEVLIPAGVLVNGATVIQAEVDSATYWHVELEGGQDVILAENLPCESYLDMGNRSFFIESVATTIQANPDACVVTRAGFCRPFYQDGLPVDAVRRRLMARCCDLGWSLKQASSVDIHLDIDGDRVEPETQDLSIRFLVPAAARDVWICSDVSVPAEIGVSYDRRALGICVQSLTIDDGFKPPYVVSADHPLLSIGFHQAEAGPQRWTTGRARLPVCLFDRCHGSFFLRIDLVSSCLQRWVRPERADDSGIPPSAPILGANEPFHLSRFMSCDGIAARLEAGS